MEFKIIHSKKQVLVRASASTEVMKRAGISATNHGYTLVVVF